MLSWKVAVTQFSVLTALAFSILILASAFQSIPIPAYGHFFGPTVEIEEFQVIFAPYPSPLFATQNSTLNFSVLDNGNNILNIQSALVITEKNSGNILDQVPYRLYEFSDITIPYVFPKPGDYNVRLDTRIIGDDKYQSQPLTANFDVSVTDPNLPQLKFDLPTILFSISAASMATAVFFFIYYRKQKDE